VKHNTQAIIENHLNLVLGLPLWNAGRAVSLGWFDFGKQISKLNTRKGEILHVAEYTIDTEAGWHIRGKGKIVVASADRFYAAGKNPYKEIETTDWEDRPGENRCDRRLAKFIQDHKKSPLIVETFLINNWGGLIISLSQGFAIEIFQHSSLDGEYWRMFRSASKTSRHLVVASSGIKHGFVDPKLFL
jgi:hypothetical protein